MPLVACCRLIISWPLRTSVSTSLGKTSDLEHVQGKFVLYAKGLNVERSSHIESLF